MRHLLGVFASIVFCAFGADAGFASGAAAAIAQSIYAGTLDGSAPDESDTAAYAAWQAQVADQAQLIGASVGYITSAGLASNVSNGGSIAQSGVVNNYLGHTELARMRDDLANCSNGDYDCIGAVMQKYEEISAGLDVEFQNCSTDECRLYHLSRIAAVERTGEFHEILLSVGVKSGSGFAFLTEQAELTRLQITPMRTSDLSLYPNLDVVARTQLRSEVTEVMCGGADVNSCSLETRYDLKRWGALNQDENAIFVADVIFNQAQAQEAVRENMRSDLCGAARGATCEATVDAEIDRLAARAARTGGVLMIVGGGLEIFAGGAAASTCATGIGCVAAAGLATHGVDTAGHGLIQLWTGEETATFGGLLLQEAGLSPAQAELVYGFIGAGLEIAALRSMVLAPASITPEALTAYRNTGVAPNNGAGGRLLWGSWDDYPKVTRTGPNGPQEYAQIGDRLYSQHAVARMQPSGQRYTSGAPVEGQPNLVGRDQTPPYVNQPGIQNFDGTQTVRGRSISPNYVEDIISNTTPTVSPTTGNRSYSSGDVLVVTSSEGRVITIVTGAD